MKAILIAIFVLFDIYTCYALYEVGYVGIWAAGFANAGSLQLLLDLVIACGLITSWIVVDARANGRNPWPYVVITLAAGSFGPLLYLLFQNRQAHREAAAAIGSVAVRADRAAV